MNLTKIVSFVLLVLGLQSSMLYAQKNLGFYAGPSAARFLVAPKNDEARSKIEPGASLDAYYETKYDSTAYLQFGLQYHYQLANLELESSSPSSGSYSYTDYRFQSLRLSIGYGINMTPGKKLDTRILIGAYSSYNFRTHIKGNSWSYQPATAIDTAGNEVHCSIATSDEFNRYDKGAISPFLFGAYLGWSTAFPVNERTSFLINNIFYLNFGSKGGGLLTGILGFGITYKL